MAELAIRGHETRGKEVIEILKMLGGENEFKLNGCNIECAYYIKNGVIYNTSLVGFNNIKLLTLEEFLEKFPYKVGDKINVYGDNLGVIISMRWEIDDVVYTIKLSTNEYEISKTSENQQPYKEAPMYLNEKANKQAEEIAEILELVKEIMEEIKLDIPDGYEFFGIDDDNKIVLTKK